MFCDASPCRTEKKRQSSQLLEEYTARLHNISQLSHFKLRVQCWFAGPGGKQHEHARKAVSRQPRNSSFPSPAWGETIGKAGAHHIETRNAWSCHNSGTHAGQHAGPQSAACCASASPVCRTGTDDPSGPHPAGGHRLGSGLPSMSALRSQALWAGPSQPAPASQEAR